MSSFAIESEDRFRRNFGRPCGPFVALALIGCALLAAVLVLTVRRKWGPIVAEEDRRFVADIEKILSSLKRMK